MSTTKKTAKTAVVEIEPKQELAKQVPQEGLSFSGVNIPVQFLKDIEVDKLDRLLEMQERTEARAREIKKEDEAAAAEKEFDLRMSQFQAEMPMIEKAKWGPKETWKYAPFEAIWPIAFPILTKLGFSVRWEQEQDEHSYTAICVASCAGHTVRTPFPVPKDPPIMSREGRQVTTGAQALASTNSQAKRHAFCNAFNIVCKDEDDDGGDASKGDKLTSFQIGQIEKKIKEVIDTGKTFDRQIFLTDYLGVETLEGAPYTVYQTAMRRLHVHLSKGPKITGPGERFTGTDEDEDPESIELDIPDDVAAFLDDRWREIDGMPSTKAKLDSARAKADTEDLLGKPLLVGFHASYIDEIMEILKQKGMAPTEFALLAAGKLKILPAGQVLSDYGRLEEVLGLAKTL